MWHVLDWDTLKRDNGLNEPSLRDTPGSLLPSQRLSVPLAQIDWGAFIEADSPAADLESGLQSLWDPLYRPFAARSARFSAVFMSALIHVSVFFLFVFIPVQPVGGSTGNGGTVITVQVAPAKDLIPQDESPASIDSAASLPSIAKKAKKPPEKRTQESLEQPKDLPVAGPRPAVTAMREKSKETDEREEKGQPEKDLANNSDGQETGDALQDSAAGTPSTASAERRFIPASGQGHNAFEIMVLSAIREAIFFPKQAVAERHYGEVIVAFAVNKDGSVSDLNVRKSSGSKILDEAAAKIIQKAAKKFPPIPEAMYRERLEYVVPIVFKERRRT